MFDKRLNRIQPVERRGIVERRRCTFTVDRIDLCTVYDE
jgi:hypothetical protein